MTWTVATGNSTTWTGISDAPDGGFSVISSSPSTTWTDIDNAPDNTWRQEVGRSGVFWPMFFFNDEFWPQYFWPVASDIVWSVESGNDTSWNDVSPVNTATWNNPSEPETDWTNVTENNSSTWSNVSTISTSWTSVNQNNNVTWS